MRGFIISTLFSILLIATTFAQKNNKGTGIGKTDFEPSQTQSKNTNEHGDKESPGIEDNNPSPHLPPDFGSQTNNRGPIEATNGNQFGGSSVHQEPSPSFPGGSSNEPTGEGEVASNGGEPVQPPHRGAPIQPSNKADGLLPAPPPTHHGELIPPQNPTLQGPNVAANVPNQPTIIRNNPNTGDRRPLNNNRPQPPQVPLDPSEIPVEHGQQQQFPPIRGPIINPNFPKIADLDTPNTPPPTAVKHEEDLDSEHQGAVIPPSQGTNIHIDEHMQSSAGDSSNVPNSGQNSGPIGNNKSHVKGNVPLTQSKNSNKQTTKSNLDEDYFNTAVNAKYGEILKNLSQANVLTGDDLSDERILKQIKDLFTGNVEKLLRENPTQSTPSPAQLEIVLQQGADKAIQTFKANLKGNQQTSNGGASQTNFGTATNSPQLNGSGKEKVNGKNNVFAGSQQPNGQVFSATTAGHSSLTSNENSAELNQGHAGVAIVTAHPPVSIKHDKSEEGDASVGENGETLSPFVSQNASHGVGFPSQVNSHNPVSVLVREPLSPNNQETFGQSSTTEIAHFRSNNPIILGSNTENPSFGEPSSSQNSSHPQIPKIAGHEHGGIIIPNENNGGQHETETTISELGASQHPDVIHIRPINQGTPGPINFKQTRVPTEGEPHNSKEAPFVVEPLDGSHTTETPSVVAVNTETLPPFVISGFNQGQTRPPKIVINEKGNVKQASKAPQEPHTDEPFHIGHPPIIIGGGNNSNTFYNISSASGKGETGEQPEIHEINGNIEEIPKVKSVAPLHVLELSSTTSHQDEVVFPIREKQTPPTQRPPFDEDHLPASAPGIAPNFGPDGHSHEQPTRFPAVVTEDENEVTDEQGNSFLHTSFITRGPLLPLAPLQPNVSSAFVSANVNSSFPSVGFGLATQFPQPPDWSSPDDVVVVTHSPFGQPVDPINEFGQSHSNVSFVTGPPGQDFTHVTNKHEVFPPSSKPDHFSTEQPETTRPFSDHPMIVNVSSTNSSTEASIVIVHPGHLIPNLGESTSEIDLKNHSYTKINETAASVNHLFDTSTTPESDSSETDYTTTESHLHNAHNMTTTEHPIFPVIFGNEVYTTKDSNILNQSSTIPLVLGRVNNTLNETNHVSGATEITMSPHLTTFGLFSKENITSEMPHFGESGLSTEINRINNGSVKPFENSTAEPIPVGEWSKSTPEPIADMAKNHSMEPKSEPEWTKVTATAVLNETASTTFASETTKSKSKGATATWSLKLLDVEWDSSLNDKASWQFKDLYASIYPELKQIFQELLKERFDGLLIKHFSQGSVIVNGETDIKEKIDNTQLNKEFEIALEQRGYKLGGHTVDKNTINVDHPGGSAPQTGARPIGANGVPGYVIGIIVAAIILALVVIAVALLVRRYRTRRLREDHYMVDEETMNGGAVKNWQQHQRPANGRDNYAAVNMYEMKDNPNGSANPQNAHTNYGYQANEARANGHSAPSRHNNSNMSEIQLHGDQPPVDEASTRH